MGLVNFQTWKKSLFMSIDFIKESFIKNQSREVKESVFSVRFSIKENLGQQQKKLKKIFVFVCRKSSASQRKRKKNYNKIYKQKKNCFDHVLNLFFSFSINDVDDQKTVKVFLFYG